MNTNCPNCDTPMNVEFGNCVCPQCGERMAAQSTVPVQYTLPPKKKSPAGLVLAVLGGLFILLLVVCIGGVPLSNNGSQAAVVGVKVFDATEARPLPQDAELWFRGYGSFAIADGIRVKLGQRPIGEQDSIMLYPDGRDGAEITIPK